MSEDDEVDQDSMADEWAAAMEEQAEIDGAGEDEAAANNQGAAPMELSEFDEPAAAPASQGNNPDLDVILDIPVSISMEVGRTSITIRNLLQLNQGSVIELDRLAGEPLDVLVNGTLIAHGEVVVVNEKFGIRMTDVISPSERIKKLR
ncbi:flagellar motor switch protein FliN [Teredinibacter turnerae]|uniref:Flagellar motor switch protein FliN n=1 Tax=Teredinibacter turnerae (strain ATCC 39867 / T7901) TaxID=377629 RepID=C5BSG1_TERTT|nr:flagellar motor switch protein FliN [Teredinibacter turnerae]ACR13403.1 flagellar motor switch protein FliN [Teredinibacter turnerae T7901]